MNRFRRIFGSRRKTNRKLTQLRGLAEERKYPVRVTGMSPYTFDPSRSSHQSATQALSIIEVEEDGAEDQVSPPLDSFALNTTTVSSLFAPGCSLSTSLPPLPNSSLSTSLPLPDSSLLTSLPPLPGFSV